jgi:hypothetical protein
MPSEIIGEFGTPGEFCAGLPARSHRTQSCTTNCFIRTVPWNTIERLDWYLG